MKKKYIKKRRNVKVPPSKDVLKFVLPAICIAAAITGASGNHSSSVQETAHSSVYTTPSPAATPTPAPTPTPKPLSAQDILVAARQNPAVSSELIDDLQNILNRNPETEPFVKNYFTSRQEATGGIKEKEKQQSNPLFIQWDRRWGYVPYGDNTIGLSGCAPTCLSMVLFSLTRNESATPDSLAAYSMEKGYYVSGTGTAWELMTDIPPEYPVTATVMTPTEESMLQHLQANGQLICSMGPGDFTDTGHFIVIYGIENNEFLINDPFSHANSERTWSYQELYPQINNMWAYSLK